MDNLEINISHYEMTASKISIIDYMILKLLVYNINLGKKYLQNEKERLYLLELDGWIVMIGDDINLTNQTYNLFNNKEDKIIILDKFNSLKKEYLHILRKTTLTPSIEKFINGRLKNHTANDICKVLDFKFNQWHNSNMEKYLRIETLLNATKFESYIDEAFKDTYNKNSSKFDFI